MEKGINRPIVIIIMLAILCGYLFFFHLGNSALTDPDETFYAQTAKEMLNRGEWLTPYLYGKPQFEKPIFFYWVVEASYKIFGVNEFAARFPSAVFGLIGVIAVYFLGMLLYGKRVGILSAIILATNIEYVILSRACITDMALGTFILLGMLFFLYGYIRKKPLYYSLTAAALALAVLTKGPVGLALPGLTIFIYLIITGELVSVVKKAKLYWPILILAAIAIPWYLVMYKTHGKFFIEEFFGFRNLTRFLEPEHKIGSQFYYYVPIVLGALFPWSAFLPFAFWQALKKSFKGKDEDRKYSIFLLLWFLVIFIFFSISGTKLPTYIFPTFGALAIMIALVWDEFLKELPAPGTEKWMKASYYLLFSVIVIGVAVLYFFIKKRYSIILGNASIAGAFLIFGFILSLFSFISKRYLMTFFFIVYSLLIFTYPLVEVVVPDIGRYETSKDIAEKLAPMMKPDEALASESNYRAGLAFYTGKFPADIDKHGDLVRFMSSDKRVWLVQKEKNHRQLYELDTKPFYTRPSYMVYKLGKKCIVTNQLPADGKYILKRERTR
jgi:4-amino-4-deoxy-L-arabinose transferase-like glycosyltransferase